MAFKQHDAAQVCLVVRPKLDNVAVAKVDLTAGDSILFKNSELNLIGDVPRGGRFSLETIQLGASVVQYGHPFCMSRGIEPGDVISKDNTHSLPVITDYDLDEPGPNSVPEDEKEMALTFQGYGRDDGKVGTRNIYLIVPTSQCASETAAQLARLAERRFLPDGSLPGLDGIVAIPNTEGCGCARNRQIERFLRIIKNFITHPNVGGVLLIDLGCEHTNYKVLNRYLKQNRTEVRVPCDWLTIQREGGVGRTIEKAMAIIGDRMDKVKSTARCSFHIDRLVMGTECGASDSFSGITANPLIGGLVDRVVMGRGSAILSETPEMIGAEVLLMRRMRDADVRRRFMVMMAWYRETARSLGVKMSDNLVAENQSGGLMNDVIKSLGAIAKGGNMPIEDVLGYGQSIRRQGLQIMQGPGNDMESVTGMTASGATIISFSTGRGTVTGSAIVPVIKIASTSEVAHRLSDDIDFDAGFLLDHRKPGRMVQNTAALMELLLAVASGKRTKAEMNGQRQFQVWTAGKLSL
jgi:altronate dehydratase